MYSLKIAVFYAVTTLTYVHGGGASLMKKLNDGHEIPGLGFGSWLGFDITMFDSQRPVDDRVQRAVEWAIDAGYRLFDTAFIYYTEEQVGQAVKNKIAEGVLKREDVYISTKLWNTFHKRGDVVNGLKLSLKNLNMEYVDVYLMHFPFAYGEKNQMASIDYLETWQGMVDVQKRGLARSIGVSNFNQQQLERLISKSSVKPAVLENEVNLNQQPSVLLSFCRRHNITVLGYTPFGSLFNKKAKPGAPPPRVDDPTLVRIAKNHNKTVPLVALRYSVELGVVPIPISFNKRHIEENIKVFDFSLTENDQRLLRRFNRYYRTLDISIVKDSLYYPYEKEIL